MMRVALWIVSVLLLGQIALLAWKPSVFSGICVLMSAFCLVIILLLVPARPPRTPEDTPEMKLLKDMKRDAEPGRPAARCPWCRRVNGRHSDSCSGGRA